MKRYLVLIVAVVVTAAACGAGDAEPWATVDQRDVAEEALADVEAALADLGDHHAELTGHVDELTGHVSVLEGELDEVTSWADALDASLAAAERERDEALAVIAALTVELDEARESVATLTAERDELSEAHEAVAVLTAQRDQLVEALGVAEAALAAPTSEPRLPEPQAADPAVPESSSDCGPGQVDINTASLSELQRIIHIGPARAEALVGHRPFTSVQQLTRISGIASARITDIHAQGVACV